MKARDTYTFSSITHYRSRKIWNCGLLMTYSPVGHAVKYHTPHNKALNLVNICYKHTHSHVEGIKIYLNYY